MFPVENRLAVNDTKGANGMNKLLLMRAACVVLAAALTSGCVYMNVQRPLDTNFELVAWGDAGSKAAAADGGIEVINHADTKVLLILGGLFARTTTVAYGD